MNSKGFTLIEIVLSMYIISISVMFISAILFIVTTQSLKSYVSEDENSIQNLRRTYVLSENVELDGDMLSFRYLMQDMYFQLIDDKLVLREGYQVYFQNLEYGYFTKEQGCVYVTYKHKKEAEKKRIIGC